MGRSLRCAVFVLLSLLPATAFAQAGIGGVVRDASGAVLPGVAVTITSPALIEKTQTAITDGGGQYRFVNLRPGTYEVTFALAGFSTVTRPGIELSGDFVAAVSADLRVGALAETITVSGETPVVDVRNTLQQAVLSREEIDAIPAAQSYYNLGILIPGVKMQAADVGGASGDTYVPMSLHGSRDLDQVLQIDGFPSYNWVWMAAPAYGFTNGNFQELTFDVSGRSPETEASGIRVNMIPREGGNAFSGRFFGNYAPRGLQATNVDDDLRARGITSANRLRQLYHANPSVGGPILRDRLWFFVGYTQSESSEYIPNRYFNSCLTCWDYRPDLSRPAYRAQMTRDVGFRATWQATPRNKFGTYIGKNRQRDQFMFFGSLYTYPAQTPDSSQDQPSRNSFYTATWQSPITNRLLVEAGFATSPSVQPWNSQPGATEPQIFDFGYNVNYRNITNQVVYEHNNPMARAALNYVTGSHAIKVGWTGLWGELVHTNLPAPNMAFQAFFGEPIGVTYYAIPVRKPNTLQMTAIFAQDQWTIRRFTVNLGLRYDRFNSDVVGTTNPATPFVPAARVIQDQDVLRWRDLSPRVGLAYDVFGNGRTAVKVQAGRYVAAEGALTLTAVNPLYANLSMNRTWFDANSDRVPQGDPQNPLANGEIGPSQNLRFGLPTTSLRLDPELAEGFNVRPANWEFSAELEQQLIPRVSVNVGWFRRQYFNQTVTQNQAVAPADYDPFCVTVPQDSRLPAAGQQLCGLFNIRPTALGRIDNVRTSAENFGGIEQTWNGADFTIQARPRNLLLQGGISVGHSTADVCAVISTRPNVTPALGDFGFAANLTTARTSSQQYCRGVSPWQADGKLLAAYTLPWDVQVSGTYRDAAGQPYYANGVFTSAQVAPSLGRPLSTGATVTVRMASIGALYTERLRQVDTRLAKTFRAGRTRLQGQLDFYNLFNTNPAILVESNYGATTGAQAGAPWAVPLTFLTPRIVKFGVQVEF